VNYILGFLFWFKKLQSEAMQLNFKNPRQFGELWVKLPPPWPYHTHVMQTSGICLHIHSYMNGEKDRSKGSYRDRDLCPIYTKGQVDIGDIAVRGK